MAGQPDSLDCPPEPVFCSLCLDSVAPDDVVTLRRCSCSFCTACLRRMVRVHVAHRSVHLLRCPAGHDGGMDRDEVKLLSDPDTFLAYVRQRRDTKVLLDPSLVFCPRPSCGRECRVGPRPGARPIRCVDCGMKFCCSCRDQWPGPGHRCPQDVETAASVASDTHQSASGRKRVTVKRCPKCGIPMMREEGCPQMLCPRCGHVFCWQCMTDLSKDIFLRHFEQGECKQKPEQVWGHRVQAAASVFGLGCLALLLSPLLIFCMPCLVMCGVDLFSGFDDSEERPGPRGVFRRFERQQWDQESFGEETDDLADVSPGEDAAEVDAGDLER